MDQINEQTLKLIQRLRAGCLEDDIEIMKATKGKKDLSKSKQSSKSGKKKERKQDSSMGEISQMLVTDPYLDIDPEDLKAQFSLLDPQTIDMSESII